ncbi:4'-phosphopantetheinyl transferase [Glaciihabitans tibetensis]|uniref:4'-phosphopantetheinyl transferase n=2 Tax=Glaciihabitans tibetensis TaxID=1266600 RepID=A0A2T0VEJ9_9MICO|nr:4'-phosphopantetheinyl transferase [Glaciihabitans tibetensis]
MRPQLDANAHSAALAVISPAERQRYDTTVEAKRESFLAGRWMLRQLVSELTGVHPAAVALVAQCPDCGGPHGQPRVEGSRLAVSLSRSADAVVAAAAWDSAVGVDVEPLDQPAAATSAIEMLTGEPSLLRWTRVEAILKADGRGLRVDPGEVVLSAVNGAVEGWVRGSATRYRVIEVELAPGVRVSVASSICG